MNIFRAIRSAWFETVSTPEIWLERFFVLISLPRILWLLPTPQSQFSPLVSSFTEYVPQQAWGLLSVYIAWRVWRASCSPYLHGPRVRAAYWVGAHWLALGVLYLLGEPRATAGWFYLSACVGPLLVITRLSPPRAVPKEGESDA